jgi:protein TonB
MRIVYIRQAMAVQIFMPDAAVQRGESVSARLLEFPSRASVAKRAPIAGRAFFVAGVIALHVLVFVGLLNRDRIRHVRLETAPILAAVIESPPSIDEQPPEYVPPPAQVQLVMPVPQELVFDAPVAITPPPPTENVPPAAAGSTSSMPPLVESVEYVRAPKPFYPSESNRKRERGTVLLRVTVDTQGRPAQIEVERSSGFDRLDDAARDAVQRALFRPHEVDGVAQAAQVLIPIEFTRRAT